MTGTLVDSNVLLDIATADERWCAWSESALADAARSGPLVINAVIYGEISLGYERIEDLDTAVPPDTFVRAPLPYEAAFLAARSYLTYRKSGGRRERPLPDFFIGAHAAVSELRLLTRDAVRFRTYFPTITIVAP